MAHSIINEVYMPIAPETSDGKLPSTRNVAIAPEATEWKLPSSRKVAVVCLILTETGLFSTFVAAYVFYLGKSLTGPTPREVKIFWLATIVLAAIFLASTAAEWRRLIYQKGLTISTNLFGTTFYSLVGLHASHVIVGMCLLLLVFIFSLRGFVTIMHRERLQMISWYWHFVDAVWIVVFTVVYVAGR